MTTFPATRTWRTHTLPPRQHGMALVIVLWLVVLLSVMAAGHARGTRAETMLAARQAGFAKARALAAAGINHVIIEMLSANAPIRRPADGTVFTIAIAGNAVTLAIRNATGLVDLNAAGAGLLDDTLRFCGAGDEVRAGLVDAILDWRDGDHAVHLNGVEDRDYLAAGLPWTARDGRFESIDELRYVLGMQQDLFECLESVVTLYSGRGRIELPYAPTMLASAINEGERLPAAPLDTRARPGVRTGTYHIYSTAIGQSGAVAAIEAVVRLTGSAADPYTVLEWREPPRAMPPPVAGGPT
jgi:general secretion pathway protein K